MIKIENKTECMGCHACFNKCPKQAIEMVEDEKGFKYPKVNKEKCIECGLCEKVCPIINNRKILNEPKAYAIINKKNEIREKSSSGGIFTLLAEYVIKNGGVVFGAAFDENWNVKHYYVEDIQDINIFRGSKYMQSIIGNTYKQAEEFLKDDRIVLFTGTPCQIEGLKAYLGKEYDKLYTQDIICHGVPSPKVHNIYLEYLKKKFKANKIENISHRDKVKGWKNFNTEIKFDTGKYTETHDKDLYMQAFLRDTILRDSCYDCKFKKKNRISDITLADFWGIQNILPEMDDDKGTSLMIINSKKGNNLFENIKNNVKYQEVDFENAIRYNQSMIKSVNMDRNRDKFFENLDKIEFDKLVKKYTYTPRIARRIIRKTKKLIKKLLKIKR